MLNCSSDDSIELPSFRTTEGQPLSNLPPLASTNTCTQTYRYMDMETHTETDMHAHKLVRISALQQNRLHVNAWERGFRILDLAGDRVFV